MTARGWLEPALRRFTLIAAALTLAAAAVIMLTGSMPVRTQAIIMAVAVALFGLPHGAYDLEIARRSLGPRLGRVWLPAFVGAYLVIAALAAGLWWIAPSVGLGLLLIMGALHWGEEDLESRPARRGPLLWLAASRGAVPVAVPCLAHPAEVAAIFAALGAEWAPGAIGWGAAIVLAAAGPGVAASWALAWRARPTLRRPWTSGLEIGSIVAMLAVAPPLLGFTLYFCGWHSVRHSMRSMAGIDPARPRRAIARYLAAVAAPTLATIALAAAVLLWRARAGGGWQPTGELARVVFIGLFALTVPHVALDLLAPGEPRKRPHFPGSALGAGAGLR